MPHAELVAWHEYAEIEPFGDHYADLRAGGIQAAIYNVNRDPKQRPEPFRALDFVPWNSLAEHAPAVVDVVGDVAHAAMLDAVLFGRPPG